MNHAVSQFYGSPKSPGSPLKRKCFRGDDGLRSLVVKESGSIGAGRLWCRRFTQSEGKRRNFTCESE